METKKTQIANFNCTFQLADKTYPMLDYLDSLIVPAVTDNSFVRNAKGANFYLAEVRVVNLSDDAEKKELALIGKHIKRVQVDIRNDFDPSSGLIPIGERHPSAPFSTFILLLRNHRLIHFGDQTNTPSSPGIRTLALTFETAIKRYRKQHIKDVIDGYEKDGVYPTTTLLGKVSKERFLTLKDLRSHLINSIPMPIINVVPIPHPNIVEERIKDFSKIEELKFNVFTLNSEMQVNDLLRDFNTACEQMKTSGGSGIFKNPTNFDKVTEFVKGSKGQADLKMIAYIGNNKINMSTEDFVENIFIDVPRADLLTQGKGVYNELKNREELHSSSDENMSNYQGYVSKYS